VYGIIQVAANMFSTLPPNRITTVGLDISQNVLRDVEEIEHLERLGVLLSSHYFSRLSRILVRIEGDPPFDDSQVVIDRIFSWIRARGILQVEMLPYQIPRRSVFWELFDPQIS
jgi:hypothetical protein